MSNFKRIGGRYGQHSGSGKWKYGEFTNGLWVQGNSFTVSPGNVWYVDGDVTTSGSGNSWETAFKTIQEAVTAASAEDTIYVVAKTHTDYTGDPASYAETIIIPYTASNLAIIGVSRGRTQGGLPQIKKGSGSTALLTIRAPGCLIANLGFNGSGSTGGGILLDDDYAAKAAFGTSIIGCHFKNCKVTTKHAETGGAIYTTAAGNAWQLYVGGNRFYKNEGDIILVGTSNTVPQDWVIEDNVFSGPAANVDCNIYTGGSGVNGIIIRNNVFTAIPAIGSGTNTKMLHLTGSVGILAGNMFACQDGRTFGASGDELVPTTVFMAGNFSEKAAAQVANGGDVYRT